MNSQGKRQMDNIKNIIAAADKMAHVCAEAAGRLDVAGSHSLSALVNLCQETSAQIKSAVDCYWREKGTDTDGMPTDEGTGLERKVQRRILDIEVPIYHPEDATVNGEPDYRHQTPMMPYLVQVNPGLEWKWLISVDVETGEVIFWPQGVNATTNYKVVDECKLHFGAIDYEGYVPDFLGIDDKSWGDYICITIKEDGFIKNWDKTKFYEWVKDYHLKSSKDNANP